MSEPKHTALPWCRHGGDPRRILKTDDVRLDDQDRIEIARCGYDNRTDPESDAAHIVRCVNAMPAMVEALHLSIIAIEQIDNSDSAEMWDRLYGAKDSARAAIKAYEES